MTLPTVLRVVFLNVLLLAAAGCEFEAPLAPAPEAPVDPALLGRWSAPDGWAKLCQRDTGHYVLVHNGTVYEAWHARLGERDFLTLRSLETTRPRHHFLLCERVGDRRVDVRFVRDDLVPRGERNPAALRRAVEESWGRPELLGPAVTFIRMD